MQKEIYKLVIVFIMIILSFSIAFFLGREITLKGQKQETPATYPAVLLPTQQSPRIKEPAEAPSPLPKKTQKEKVQDYKSILIDKKPQQELKQETSKPIQTAKNLKPKPLFYGLFIASYKVKKVAMDESTQLKIRFPAWDIFFKKEGRMYKVYIGPFKEKALATSFLNELTEKSQFPAIRVEAIFDSKK